MADWLSTLGVAVGSAWLSGINLYATAATLGLLQRFGLVHLPGELGALSNWWVICVAAAMYLIEFVADKIPVIDNAWDIVHTFIRVPAGAVMAAAAFSHAEPAVRIIALLVGGGVALSSHGTKAAARATANLSPEPFTNIALSLAEDMFTVGSSFLVAWFPVVMLGMVVLFLGVFFWLAPKILRTIRRSLGLAGPALAPTSPPESYPDLGRR
jgi:Domain of unknown function (DUF4126)